ncbi:MAG: hypothetical protein R3F30_01720 [Planctomycetota bacterium]
MRAPVLPPWSSLALLGFAALGPAPLRRTLPAQDALAGALVHTVATGAEAPRADAATSPFALLGPLPVAPSALDLALLRHDELRRRLERGLERGDPALALAAARAMQLRDGATPAELCEARHRLGRAWLMAGRSDLAEAYAGALLAEQPRDPKVRALAILAALRGGRFADALDLARRAARELGLGDLELHSAYASALFRNQRLREAEQHYRAILEQDPRRRRPRPPRQRAPGVPRRALGSGPGPRPRALGLGRPAGRPRRGPRPARARPDAPGRPAPGRRAPARGQATRGPLYARPPGRLLGALERTGPLSLDLGGFFPDAQDIQGPRRELLALSSVPFQRRLARIALSGGSHDILGEVERTTDDGSRRWLRGKRTFDGRSWDDVRGIGGLAAATGVEALDEALGGGFQTLVHELAHQVHQFGMTEEQKRRVTELYRRAKAEGRVLDYYAASNEAEYFAQGVEAYFSFCKAAGQPVTHGHTHYELLRRDPALATLIASVVEWDPMRGPLRLELLARSLYAALRLGRAADAATILELLPAAERSPELERAVRGVRNRFAGI